MNFIDILKIANDYKINITKLFVANEVNCLIGKDISSEEFEKICLYVYEYYLKIEYASINDVANIVILYYMNKKEISEIIVKNELENLWI